MADSIFNSLLKMLDSRDLRARAGALGEPEHSVSRGMQSSIAAVMAVLASKADDPGALRKTLDLYSSMPGSITWANVVESVSDPQSPLIAEGKRLLSSLFGSSESTVIDSIAKGSGLRPNAATTLLSVAAPFVLSYINKRVRDEGITISALGSILQQDTPAIRNGLPAGLTAAIWPTRISDAVPASRGIAQEVMVRRRSSNWFAPVALAALALSTFWLLNQARRAAISQYHPARTGQASRTAPGAGGVRRGPVPDGVQSPAGTASRAKTADHADLMYRTGSATLLPESQKRLDHVAAQLAALPDAHINVAGYTDNVGDEDRNLKLSQKRADNVMAYLVNKGVDPARLSAKGYGKASPIADNSTAEGRAKNRRVIVIVQ